MCTRNTIYYLICKFCKLKFIRTDVTYFLNDLFHFTNISTVDVSYCVTNHALLLINMLVYRFTHMYVICIAINFCMINNKAYFVIDM